MSEDAQDITKNIDAAQKSLTQAVFQMCDANMAAATHKRQDLAQTLLAYRDVCLGIKDALSVMNHELLKQKDPTP